MLVHCVWQTQSWRGTLQVSGLMLPYLSMSFLASVMWHDSGLHAISDCARPLKSRIGIS